MNIQNLNFIKEEFDNLIFMGPPPVWEKHPQEHSFLLSSCFKLFKSVVELVLEETRTEKTSVLSVLDGLQHIMVKNEDIPGFKRHLSIARAFAKSLMDRLWIRNITKSGREKESGGKFYFQDGKHRTLVYASKLDSLLCSVA